MTFNEIVRHIFEKRRGYLVVYEEAMRQAADEILAGFGNRSEADFWLNDMLKHGGEFATAWGYIVDAACLAEAIAVCYASANHKQKRTRVGRQICCTTCHVCGTELKLVLDGESWCSRCQSYR